MAPRWIVFDTITASELKSRMASADVFEAPGRSIVEYALARAKAVVVVLPASGSDPAIAVFRPEKIETPLPEKSARTRPRGILGLSEEIEYEEEAPQEKKRRWWR